MPGASRTVRFGVAALILVLVGGVAMGLVSGLFGRLGSSFGISLGGTSGGTEPTPGSTPAGTPATGGSAGSATTATATPQTTLAPVLDAVGGEVSESGSALGKRIAAVDRADTGGRWTGSVLDVSSGDALFGKDKDRGFTPASTMKLLTGVSALQLLGPEHRFATTVVAGSGDRIVLVGGGDPYLALTTIDRYPTRASITTLANSTAAALTRQGRTSVSLAYDTSLFSGPARNPEWPASYSDQVTSITSLWVDEGRKTRYGDGPRVSDPTGVAVKAFAAALKKKGITVRGTAAGRAPAGATTLASVSSMPLGQVVQELLRESDNDAAEVVFRHVGLAAAQPASFTGGAAGVQQALTDLGVWADGTRIYDGSGLTRANRVSADLLTRVIAAAARPDRPRLRPLLGGLPTAAVDGSLRYRFDDEIDADGRGVLRAKTGTLSKVHALAGYVLTRDGALVAFAFVTNDVKNDYDAVQWLDHVSAAVAGCGCRG